MAKEFYTSAEAAEYLGMSRTTLWRAVSIGLLPSSGRGKSRRYRRHDLDSLPGRLPRSLLSETLRNAEKR